MAEQWWYFPLMFSLFYGLPALPLEQSCNLKEAHKWIHSVLQASEPNVVQQDRRESKLVANEYQ